MINLTSRQKILLTIELLILGAVIPTIVISNNLGNVVLMIIWVITIICLALYYLTKPTSTNALSLRKIWNGSEVSWVNLKPILLRWIAASIALIIFIYLYDPDRAFSILSSSPEFWLMIMFFYPVASALPQEFIFCTFFFARYLPLLKTERNTIIVSAIVFAYAHVLFINWVAPVLSLVAGYLFASTFAKHKSLALVTIEHALYGNTLFTIGLGWYFWGGAGV